MENKPDQQENYNTPKKTQPIGLIILLILLLVAASALTYVYFDLKKESKQKDVELIQLSKSKDSLDFELNNLYQDFDTLKSENDSMNILIEAQQDRILSIIKNNNYNKYQIGQYKKELKTLREIMKSFVVQIDSLNTKNQLLTAENIEIKTKLNRTESERERLKEEKELLNSKVKMASVLSAKDILAVTLNKNSKERDKARIVEKIRTCFTIRENPIVPAGEKNIYLRIYRPDEFLMTPSAENIFESKDGTLIYSATRKIQYENQDVPLCIFYDKTEEFVEGTYKVELYAEGNMIGETTFTLR